ncbi:MAG TPA: alpha-1,4-glucan--maltose-1-phosphate maltosyltransferase [Candidatus Methylomirabilis sp.]|nr:alpha-1,4-glucan--maltose-1-phosphate maltosyltransferase [Candidatus Methylomirabilis sp.]
MTTNRSVRGDVRTVWIGNVWPELDGGRFPVKREVGDLFEVTADILREGHEALAAVLKYRTVKDTVWREVRMDPLGNDRWIARFPLEENTRYLYTIEAFPAQDRSWAEDLRRRLAAGMEVTSELLEGASLLRRTLPRAAGADRKRLEARLADFDAATESAARARILLDQETGELMDTYPDRSSASRYDGELEVVADRTLARFAAWYEMFPRSQGRVAGRHGTFKNCIDRLPQIAAMGFDVIYLPPIHPIGRSFRKGKNNSLTAGPDDPGSPWAIGNEQGGHKAVEPALGPLDDFRAFVRAARELRMEVALDYALQCSPDHPYAREHPEWFHARPDGTIKYAENPPKKYQDIYPLNFYCRDREALWEEMKSIFLFWIQQGVRIFRVDNPHTKPIPFWAWVIGEVQAVHPDVIFLSEAFTRPKVMQALAKVGFTQSYTYFTWRNFKPELIEYFTELTQSEMAEYFRGNLFTNTPDILPPILQQGGRPAFKMRLVLAATLSSVYGIYSGYELCENVAVPGTEEYLNSEKYEIKVRDWNSPGNIREYLSRINAIRRENAALAEYRNLRFFESDDDNILFYGKRSFDGTNAVLVAVNLDPFETHQAQVQLPLAELGIGPEERFQVHELITDERHLWKGPVQSIRLDPREEPAAIFRLSRFPHKDYGTPCY